MTSSHPSTPANLSTLVNEPSQSAVPQQRETAENARVNYGKKTEQILKGIIKRPLIQFRVGNVQPLYLQQGIDVQEMYGDSRQLIRERTVDGNERYYFEQSLITHDSPARSVGVTPTVRVTEYLPVQNVVFKKGHQLPTGKFTQSYVDFINANKHKNTILKRKHLTGSNDNQMLHDTQRLTFDSRDQNRDKSSNQIMFLKQNKRYVYIITSHQINL